MKANVENISLYIHFPWCVKKCPYCDFNSHALKGEPPYAQYVEHLINELQQQHCLWASKTVSSIFMGGGTPSLFSSTHLAPLFHYLRQSLDNFDQIEITLEANPGTGEQSRFESYRQIGINRLSIGVQSFNDKALKKLGRIHNGKTAINAFHSARQAGFNNINLDIMFALPDQTLTEARDDVSLAIDLKPEHLSWYHLTLEPNTLFHRFPPSLPDTDLSASIQEEGQALLKQHHYSHYEVSAYTQPQHACRHNLQYWTFGDYLGIGAGAHSKIADKKNNRITRHWNRKNPRDYLNPQLSYKENQSTVQGKALVFEFFLNRFRLHTPISEHELLQRTGLNFQAVQPTLDTLIQKKLITIEQKKIKLSLLGQHFLNDVLEHWL